MAQHLSRPGLSGVILAVACLLCVLALPFVPGPARLPGMGGISRTVAFVVRDLWSTVKVRTGFLALLICFLPIGTGAASQLWSAVAGDWHASASTVALVTGVLAGVLSMI